MTYLGNPNVIELYGVYTQTEPYCIVTELVTHGSLLKYLQSKILHMY
jgi:serine/threonine protein kinase